MRRYVLIGYIGPIIAFAGMLISAYINRDWWRITDNAVSDLGRVGLPYNYILNVSFILSGILTSYSMWYVQEHMRSVSRVGMIQFMLTFSFLFLVGVFPEGTAPHGLVSGTFLFGTAFSIMFVGVGFIMEKNISLGLGLIAIVISEFALAGIALEMFKGIAVAEVIGAIGVTLSYYLILFFRERGE